MSRVAIQHLIERVSESITIASGATSGTFTFRKPGKLRGIRYSTNNNTNNVTTVITITDDEDAVIYTSAALNENTNGYLTPTELCLYDSTHTITCTSADPGASGNIVGLSLLIER